ncbi:CLK4-associating serine/arginine rich protein isoform X2 [Anthonomus grandis grandis]|uniref:CLK4-associating serine/arginine rich protein isoform X2 n=1 Tax=Anthonomus grandis grandis TaxID=2921223 RepID=UPI002166B6FF|nr:CLK4-associating serine/arginine rich protein isoform X2 [Anthonomus grandis grandis]
MWHEARRQERKIRGMLVDYRKRAERRRDFYERIKADPTQFLQIHGRQCRIHLDPAVAAAADSAVMMPWQGNENNLIDRFDVRAHLDYIPAVKKEEESELTSEDRQVNYERYRIVAQNNYLGISEEKFLKQLHLEEQFGYTENKSKKDSKGTGVAIGFNYEEGTAIAGPQPHDTQDEDNSDDENSDSDLDVDLSINISKIDPTQAHEMNKAGQQFGMAGNDFYSFLTNDMEEAETYKLAKEEEHEKALYSGRKSRRERRAHREKRLANRKISPPSYAAKESPTNALRDESKSPSRSPSPDDGEKITYITSFGDDEEVNNKPTYADKVKCGKFKGRSGSFDRGVFFDKKRSSTTKEVVYDRRKYSRSPKRSRSRSWSRRKRSRSGSGRGRSRRSNSRCRSISKRSRSGSVSLKTSRKSRSRSRSRTKRPRIRSCSGSSKSRSRRVRSRSRQASRDRRSSSQSSSPLSSSSSSSSSSRSRSLTRSRSKSRSKSKSKSVEPMETSSRSPVAPKPPIIRYYGRKKSDVSSSELSSADEEEEDIDLDSKADNQGSSDSNRFGNNSGSASKVSKKNTTRVPNNFLLFRHDRRVFPTNNFVLIFFPFLFFSIVFSMVEHFYNHVSSLFRDHRQRYLLLKDSSSNDRRSLIDNELLIHAGLE